MLLHPDHQWALRPGSDSVQSLVVYIALFATERFDRDRAR
jgi:hypothetical protein